VAPGSGLILPGAGLEPRRACADCSAVTCGRHVACRAYTTCYCSQEITLRVRADDYLKPRRSIATVNPWYTAEAPSNIHPTFAAKVRGSPVRTRASAARAQGRLSQL
jgi:hypothetical protein